MGDKDSLTDLFDRQVKGIRTHRKVQKSEQVAKKVEFIQGWYEVVAEARQLQTRLQGDPRILAFSISRELDEIRIKVADPTRPRGYGYFFICREHPEGKYPGLQKVWLREVGAEDRSFDQPREALEAMVLKLATMLA